MRRTRQAGRTAASGYAYPREENGGGCMRDFTVALKKEWLYFAGSEKGVFLTYAMLVSAWSIMLATRSFVTDGASAGVWLLFFSVVVSAHFSNTVFISERLSGALEVVLCSGFSRGGLLGAKVFFCVAVSSILGGGCIALSFLWRLLQGASPGAFVGGADICMFVAAVFFNVVLAAWLTIRLASPRLIHFASIAALAFIWSVYYTLSAFVPLSLWHFTAALTVIASGLYLLVKKEFHGEKIIAPLNV